MVNRADEQLEARERTKEAGGADYPRILRVCRCGVEQQNGLVPHGVAVGAEPAPKEDLPGG